MKKILLLSALLFAFGISELKALTTNGTLRSVYGADWDKNTSTMTWKATSGYTIIGTDFPTDISNYTTLHATLSNFSENADFVRLRIKSNDGTDHYADVNLVAGENNIDLVALKAANPSVDFSNLADITIWGSTSATDGHSIDNDNPASVSITNVYIYGPFEYEYVPGTKLSFSSIVSENRLVCIASADETILYGDNTDNQIRAASINTVMGKVNDNGTYRFRITEADDEGLVMPDGVSTLYRIQAFKGNGTSVYTGPWYGGNCYLNDIGWTRNIVAKDDSGEQGCFFGVTAVDGKENTYKITSYLKDGSVKTENFFGKSEWVFYVLNVTRVPEKLTVAANDAIFDVNNFENGKWTFDTPVDLYNWNYLVIATENTAANASHEIIIKDNSEYSVRGDSYNGQAAGTGAGMWLDRWNSQNIIAIDLNQLRISNGLDIFNIKSLEITGDIQPSVAYLTDYANTKITSRGRWDLYVRGDLEREYTETGKFGTICLPYKAAYAGCEVYSIAGTDGASISLTKVSGLLEAGKPYFYISSDVNGQDNEKTVLNVHFFRADFDTYDAASAGTNNGLIGTFSSITAPAGANYYILSNNTLYDTEGATGANAITVGANKAYVNKALITPSSAKGRVELFFNGADDTTGIESMNAIETLTSGKIFDISGRVVTAPTKGLYIINGKKVLVK